METIFYFLTGLAIKKVVFVLFALSIRASKGHKINFYRRQEADFSSAKNFLSYNVLIGRQAVNFRRKLFDILVLSLIVAFFHKAILVINYHFQTFLSKKKKDENNIEKVETV